MSVQSYIMESAIEELEKTGTLKGFSIGLRPFEYREAQTYVHYALNRPDVINNQSFYIRIQNQRISIFKVEIVW